MAHYDYIILGAGAAGLMLARAMSEDSWFQSKSILIIDKEVKNKNDRTWCFWEEGQGAYDHIVAKKWDYIYFNSHAEDHRLLITPFTYKMIRGIDFYSDHLQAIKKAPHIEFLQAEVSSIVEKANLVLVHTSLKIISCDYVFNSLFDINSLANQRKYPVLKQHFIGWFVKTPTSVFDNEAASFMDFSIPQRGNTRFMYVLPFSETEALVEYTLFSHSLLEEEEYEKAIKDYLENKLGTKEYEIQEKEKGQIPMTCYDFESNNTERILHIGTAGGWAKPSTGFTFKNTTRNTKKLIRHLKKEESFKDFSVKNRFRLYDMLLLDILDRDNAMGSVIFGSLFKKRKPMLILKFLDEQSSQWEDLQVITGCPTVPFSSALLRRLFK